VKAIKEAVVFEKEMICQQPGKRIQFFQPFEMAWLLFARKDMMETIARYLIIAGVILVLLGGGIYLAAKFGIPLGRLPGDIHIEGENGRFYFPVTSSILVSVVLTILLNMVLKLLKK
jgi:hypothetical protein